MKKGILSVILLAAFLAAAAGCGSKEAETNTEISTEYISDEQPLLIVKVPDSSLFENRETEDDAEVSTELEAETVQKNVMINSFGYLPKDTKIVMIRTESIADFAVIDADTMESVFEGRLGEGRIYSRDGFAYKLGSFGEISTPGNYYISSSMGDSEIFRIDDDVYTRALRMAKDSLREAGPLSAEDSDYVVRLLFAEEMSGDDEFPNKEALDEYIESCLSEEEDDLDSCLMVAAVARASRIYDVDEALETKVAEYLADSSEMVLELLNSGEEDVDGRISSASLLAASELYLSGVVSEGELKGIDFENYCAGFDKEDCSGYALTYLATEGSGDLSKRAGVRIKEMADIEVNESEEKLFSVFSENSEDDFLTDDDILLLLAANAVAKDNRYTELAKLHFDSLLGTNPEGICYLEDDELKNEVLSKVRRYEIYLPAYIMLNVMHEESEE